MLFSSEDQKEGMNAFVEKEIQTLKESNLLSYR